MNFHAESNNRFDFTIWFLSTFTELEFVTRWADPDEKGHRKHEFEPLFDMLESGVVSQADSDRLSRHSSRSNFAADVFRRHNRFVNANQLLLQHGIRREGPVSAADVLLGACSDASLPPPHSASLQPHHASLPPPHPQHSASLHPQHSASLPPPHPPPHEASTRSEGHDRDATDDEVPSPRPLSQSSLSMLLNDEPSNAAESRTARASSSLSTRSDSWHELVPFSNPYSPLVPFSNPYSPLVLQYQPTYSPVLPPVLPPMVVNQRPPTGALALAHGLR